MKQRQPSIEITEKGNAWIAMLGAVAIAALGIGLAVAVWQVSVGLSLALGFVGAGEGLRRFCYGVAIVVYHARLGQAEIERARLEAGTRPLLEE